MTDKDSMVRSRCFHQCWARLS